jgi:DNA primase
MGTALTERQLRELGRLTQKVVLCFDGDAAGEAATLRGMELAAAQGFDVRVVALPEGLDPADLADGFEKRIAGATSYLLHRVRLEVVRAPDRQDAFVRAREVLGRFEDSPERQEALRFVADRLDLPKETQAGLAPRAAAAATGRVSPRLLDAGERLERNALAGVAVHRALVPILAELGPEHFDSDVNRRVRALLLGEGPDDPDLVGLVAELDARAAADGIDERTARELLLRLRERRIRRELADADPSRTLELQGALAKIRAAVEELAAAQALTR